MSTTTQPGTVPRKKLSPRKRAQRIRWIQYAILAAVLVLVVLNVDGRQVQSVFFRTDLIQVTLTSGLPRALLNTVLYTFGAFVFGLTLASPIVNAAPAEEASQEGGEDKEKAGANGKGEAGRSPWLFVR